MVRTIWIAGAFALLLWSLASWGFGSLLAGGGDFLLAQAEAWADHVPEAPLAVQSLAAFFARFGDALLWLAWGVGAVLIVLGTWLSAVVLQALRRAGGALLQRWEASHPLPQRPQGG